MTGPARLAVANADGEQSAGGAAFTPSSPAVLSSDEIRSLLPHRWPFLYLDRVLNLRPGLEATGLKNVSVSEPYFAGHFPEQSIMPGVLLIEAFAQLAGIVMNSAQREEGDEGAEIETSRRTYLAAVHRVRFRRLVVPGDQVVLHVSKSHAARGLVEFRGDARVQGRIAVSGTLVITV